MKVQAVNLLRHGFDCISRNAIICVLHVEENDLLWTGSGPWCLISKDGNQLAHSVPGCVSSHLVSV